MNEHQAEIVSMDFLENATRNLFFTGKGGVGKTTLARATAIALANRGARVLLVSTDPASNLDEVLGVTLGNSPTPVPEAPGLLATPVHEAARLQQDLLRAGIRPFAWVINQSLSPLAVSDPVLLARRQREAPYIREVTKNLAARVAIIPWLTEAPVGAERLQAALCDRPNGEQIMDVANHGACC